MLKTKVPTLLHIGRKQKYTYEKNMVKLCCLTVHVYLPQIFRQTGLSKQCKTKPDSTMQHLINAYSLPFTSQFLDISSCSEMDLLKFQDKYGEKLRCPNIQNKYNKCIED